MCKLGCWVRQIRFHFHMFSHSANTSKDEVRIHCFILFNPLNSQTIVFPEEILSPQKNLIKYPEF